MSRPLRALTERASPLSRTFSASAPQTVRDKCIDTCVPRPGSSLSRGEQQCLAQCVARYQDATQTVGKAVLTAMGVQ